MSAHFYWIFEKRGDTEHLIPEFLSLSMMTFRRQNPNERIVLHTNAKVKTKIPDVIVDETERLSKKPFIPMFLNHSVDWLKLCDAAEIGGIFLDADQLFIRPYPKWFINPDRAYAGTFSGDFSEFSIGCFSCNKNNPFIREWLDSYRKDYKRIYTWNSCIYPSSILDDYDEHVDFIPDNHMLYPLTWGDLKIMRSSESMNLDTKSLIKDERICSIHFGHSFIQNERTIKSFDGLAAEILNQ
jgi:hypothetical protein